MSKPPGRVLIKAIESLRMYDDNWDSYGANKPSHAAIDKAIKLIESVHVCPTVNGDIALRFQLGNTSVELTVREDEQTEVSVDVEPSP